MKYSSVHNIARENSEKLLTRFNTPNASNSRNLLLQCTGYDPINDWLWHRRHTLYLNAQQTRERLNEILNVRHRFAHGFPMPAYSWTQDHRGNLRLTKTSIRDVEFFFNNLVRITDRGVKDHIHLTYAISAIW